jgi:hypothetical protein
MSPPSVAEKAAEPLMPRESTAARMTSKTASNGVFRESKRWCPSRTATSVARKNNDPTQRNLHECQIFRFRTEAQKGFKELQNAFIGKILSPEKALPRGYADSARLARETFAWHKTTLTRFSN